MLAMNRTVVCTLAAALLLAACSKQQPASTASAGAVSASTIAQQALPASLRIASWGPDSTTAGKVFNPQPNGSAALWIRLDHPVTGDVAGVEFNGVLLQGAVSGNLVTTGVPADLYAKPGSYKVDVVVRKGDQAVQSNSVTFTVH